MSSTPKRRPIKDLELSKQPRIEKDPDTGLEVQVERVRRGILGYETRTYNASNLRALKVGETPRREFEKFCDALRDQLEACGLISDRTPHWVSTDGSEWRPQTQADREAEISGTINTALWISRNDQMTEPLSEERATSDLLFAILQLLKRPGIDEHLWHIDQLMSRYYTYRVSGRINALATTGISVEANRRKGPEAKRDLANKRRELICAKALEYWSNHPTRRGDISNTAKRISECVNTALRQHGLLANDRELSAKTITDHIRAGLKEKTFPN